LTLAGPIIVSAINNCNTQRLLAVQIATGVIAVFSNDLTHSIFSKRFEQEARGRSEAEKDADFVARADQPPEFLERLDAISGHREARQARPCSGPRPRRSKRREGAREDGRGEQSQSS
jgi:hypothetical protein